ncbi:unnamed protein product [Mytilus coruscus]|uniref:Integrase catalytic domain-containing protein n=1 Tax=Mytilus coruscus TaxID=42192 RepID=A0A6J8E0B0_MYTCO|nr:unnamed protein product [Mytilus coruscus]
MLNVTGNNTSFDRKITWQPTQDKHQDQALDYDALKICLLKRFNMTEDGFKQKFRSCRPESGETFQQFSVRLGSYFSRWIDMANGLKTFDGLYDLMLKDQFLHICNNEVMLFLKERVPKSRDEITRYADQLKEARRVNIVSLTNQTQKGKSQPPQKPNNIRNQEMPRVSDRDRNRHTGGSGGNIFDRKCFTCNKSDHLISNCPFLRNKVGNVQNSDHEERKHKLAIMLLLVLIVLSLRSKRSKGGNPYPKLKVSESITDVSLEDFEREQQSDKSLMELRQYVAEGNNFEKTNGTKVYYIVKKTLIYREFMSLKVENGKTFRQLIVPKAYRTDVMKLAHESLMAGHMATRRTVYSVLSEFYWPGVESDVKRYFRSRDICQRTVPKGKQIRAPFGTTPINDVPFRRLAVYIVGPLVPVTDKGNRFILTLVDYATRYPEGLALPSIETERVAEALIDIFCRVDFPREMLTDMGAQFTSNLMCNVSRMISLRQLTTTPYHPMCNGLVERFNGTMKLILKRLCAERPRDWDKYLEPALTAYREVPQENVTFELVYGWPVRGPMTILKELWTREITHPDVRSTYEYVINLRERLESTCKLVKHNLEKASRKQSRIYNKKSRSRKMKVGQKHKVSFVATVSVIGLENEDTDGLENYESELIETPAAVANKTLRDVHINEALKANEIVKIQCLLDQFSHVLSDIPGRTDVLQHEIKLTSDDPVRFKPYPIPYAMLKTVNTEVDNMIEMNIIE